MPRWILLLVAGVCAGLFLLPVSAQAQMSSKPFSFNSPSGGAGMSIAGRQAIINQELFGLTPNVLLKSEDGRLLGLRKGPGNSAIVSSPSGEFLPGFRGRTLGIDFAAGTFNEFFVADGVHSGFITHSPTTATIDSWTGSVLQGGPVMAAGGSVDQWTSMVSFLSYRR